MSILNKKEEMLLAINKASNMKELEDLRINYLGKAGLLTLAMKEIASLSIEEKKTFGANLNSLKKEIAHAIEEHKVTLEEDAIEEKLAGEGIDVTEPVRPIEKGKIHPITQATQEIINIFGNHFQICICI